MLMCLMPLLAWPAGTPGEFPAAQPRASAFERLSYPGYAEAFRLWRAGRFGEVFAMVQPRATEGDALSQFLLGSLYSRGEGVSQDDEQAAYWWRKSAEHGFARAQNELGVALTDGWGVEPDQRQAVEWYRRAAEQGLPEAQVNLGLMYLNGAGGLESNDREAVAWFRKAADQDLGWAQYYLGLAYAQGRGVRRDRGVAIEWMRKAAGQGYTEALAYLGTAYLDGTGVKRDLAQAVYWLALAARDGHALAASRVRQTVLYHARARPPANTEVRSAADPAAGVLRTAGGKAYAYVLERDDEWVRVYFEDDHTVGYIRADQLRANRR